jgi:hypothetical protein
VSFWPLFYFGLFLSDPVPSFSQLEVQLNGGECTYQIGMEGKVFKRHVLSGISRRSDAEWCVIDAAKILASQQEERDAVPQLIAALQKYRNVDTGDGIIPVRSEIATLLGRLGDKRALDPMRDILQTYDSNVTSSSTRGVSATEHTAFPAIEEAIRDINESNE